VDFIEVAQIAQRVLQGDDNLPTDAALAVSDGIRHLLVDEFQDTSRRQHQLLSSLIAAWPEREGRTCFVVGDPMQSIYFFRDADAELFPRVKALGLEISNDEPLLFDFVPSKPTSAQRRRWSSGSIRPLSKFSPQVTAAVFRFPLRSRLEEREASVSNAFTLHLDFVPDPRPAK
jgi:hypothetical protein